ncbi:hypothetical protein V8C34DRAFT_287188 [Trichoderma compactum]
MVLTQCVDLVWRDSTCRTEHDPNQQNVYRLQGLRLPSEEAWLADYQLSPGKWWPVRPTFRHFVSNLVLASGRAQTMLYNVAATKSSRDRPEYFLDVTGGAMQQFYHLTYVPALPLVSLLGLIIAASAATGMTIYARYIQRDKGGGTTRNYSSTTGSRQLGGDITRSS